VAFKQRHGRWARVREDCSAYCQNNFKRQHHWLAHLPKARVSFGRASSCRTNAGSFDAFPTRETLPVQTMRAHTGDALVTPDGFAATAILCGVGGESFASRTMSLSSSLQRRNFKRKHCEGGKKIAPKRPSTGPFKSAIVAATTRTSTYRRASPMTDPTNFSSITRSRFALHGQW